MERMQNIHMCAHILYIITIVASRYCFTDGMSNSMVLIPCCCFNSSSIFILPLYPMA
ncbi:hypothetical protein BDF20DRAFT_891639 [Mycotypha africana]|uniref:uncharacterized protein n=1 Tax=Mycotypha africana TaxID=64632 RepID=UPI0023014D4C|nr:uncharacterized protein BDF20DRAFT_891639 [Mycotypha africana]KAI8970489.1 hypothetical protein BDF20DRAFT_891639 [Mycotypha africana]